MSRGASVRTLAGLLVAVTVGACGSLVVGQPTPTPQDFGGIVSSLADAGITVTNVVSGDSGCSDPNLFGPAIGFDASGLGATAPLRLHVYIFADTEAYARRRPDVDRCIARYATDPATFETVDAAPYVLAGQGPWPASFKAGARTALARAAGSNAASPEPSVSP